VRDGEGRFGRVSVTKLITLVVASHNEGKVREIRELLAPFGIETVSAGELGIAEPVEDGTTFAQNAEIKARACMEASGLPALSDDSGFAVAALDGAPGVYAADWAELPASEKAYSGVRRDFNMAMWHVWDQVQAKGGKDLRAHFVCALCLVEPGGDARIYKGTCEGSLIWPPRGKKGFGYDPMFVADGDAQTFAEIEPAEKHAKSHRAEAFAKFIAAEFGEY